ncbi:MAG TPA: Uma2 family endonuclease [Blastocatellia bacterium]|nr:Uma2 family endonuclease [Blastocatellia bacterium]
MASHLKHIYTPQEYLAMERAASYKSEFCNGEIFAMSGASLEHNLIVTNTTISLGNQLEGKDCDVLANDMRVKTVDSSLYTYPDIVVVCGERRFEDASVDTLLNPKLIIEVLSPSTASYDRTKKFAYYRGIESLQEYILIAQDECRVTQYVRQGTDTWIFHEATSLDEKIHLASVPCVLDLSRVYRRIEFPPDKEEESINH